MTPSPEAYLSMTAVLDALDRAGNPVVVLAQRGSRFFKVHANSGALRQLGYTLDEWLDIPAFEIIPPDLRGHVAQLYGRIGASTEPPPTVIELALMHKDGHRIRVEYAVGRTEIEDGYALVLVGAGEPKTAAQLSLLESDRIALVGALAAGFAHETNNPLTSVLLNLRSLRKLLLLNLEGQPQSQAIRCLDDITTGAERIASNVRALQTLATRSATQPVDLAAIVSSALRLAAPTLDPRAYVIRQIFPVRPVLGEESRIGQAVLAMLLFSASGFESEAADRGGTFGTDRIVVSVEERDGGVVVEVSDNGRALTADDAERAFDPFFRSPVRGVGVGFGLGIARSVASTLGGSVRLAPREGGGAAVTMWLPAAPA